MVAPLLIVSTNTACKHRTCCNIVAYEVTICWLTKSLQPGSLRLHCNMPQRFTLPLWRALGKPQFYLIRDCRQVLRFSNNAFRVYCSSKDLVEFQTIRISQDGKKTWMISIPYYVLFTSDMLLTAMLQKKITDTTQPAHFVDPGLSPSNPCFKNGSTYSEAMAVTVTPHGDDSTWRMLSCL